MTQDRPPRAKHHAVTLIDAGHPDPCEVGMDLRLLGGQPLGNPRAVNHD